VCRESGFLADFAKNGRVNMVFWWSSCGELDGKRGVLRDSFFEFKIVNGDFPA
jgi:hypothetical protein